MTNNEFEPERLMTETEVERLYGTPKKTLQHDRAHGQGLPWVKLGPGKKMAGALSQEGR